MADEKVIIELSLDDKEFVTKLLESKEKLKSLVDNEVVKKNKKGLEEIAGAIGEAVDLGPLQSFTGGLLKMGSAIGVIAAAAAATKVIFDATFESEKIDAVEAQFHLLATNAGVAADVLKDKLTPALGGLISESEGLEHANEAIVKLGSSAKQIPEIFELSRKVAKVTGAELGTTFDQVSQAIAAGNQRMLKRMGLAVNLEKAEKKYAESLGLTRNLLSDQDKIQARLNAVLETGEKKLEGISSVSKPATFALKKMGVAFEELHEEISKILAQSGAFKAFFDFVAERATSLTGVLKTFFGGGADRAVYLTGKIDELKKSVMDLEFANSQSLFPNAAATSMQVKALTEQMDRYKKELSEIQAKSAEMEKGGHGDSAAPEEHGDADAKSKQASKFEEELTRIKSAAVAQRVQIATNEQDLITAQKEREVILAQETAAKIQAINTNEELLADQKRLMIEEVEKQHQQKLMEIRLNTEAEYDRMLDNQLKHATTFAQGFAAEMAKAENSAKKFLGNTAKQGAWAFDMLNKTGTEAMMNIGMAAFDGGKALKAGLLNALADIVQQYGMAYIAMGFGNPGMFAAGAALLVLAGVIRGLAGGGGGGGSSGGTASGGSATDRNSTVAEDKPMIEEAKEKKHVSLVVQGNYFETEQTKIRLVEMVREAQDATDFTVKQIG